MSDLAVIVVLVAAAASGAPIFNDEDIEGARETVRDLKSDILRRMMTVALETFEFTHDAMLVVRWVDAEMDE